MSHRRAVALMVLATLLWSIAGVVTRRLEAAGGLELTFWRSLFNALALALALGGWKGAALWRGIARAPWPVWASGLCWGVMFTAFTVAISLTTVANVLVVMAVAPLVTALLGRLLLAHRQPARTWAAMAVAFAGIAWMFGRQLGAEGGTLAGSVVALAVPLASACNLVVLQYSAEHGGQATRRADMPQALLIGALLSVVATLPFALPPAATPHDLGLLALLGVVQLAIPCLLLVRLSRELPAPELSLLGLLEVVFGVAWAWLFVGEQPGAAALAGGALVLGALAANEGFALRARRALPRRAA